MKKRLETKHNPNRKSRPGHAPHRRSRPGHEPQRNSWRWAGAGFSALLILVIVVGTVGSGSPRMNESPNEIRGAWVASDPRYRDCTLEITRYRILFRNPHTRAIGNDIREIKVSGEGERRRYEIRYEDEEKMVDTITLHYSRGKGGEVIQIKNQERISWTRALLPQGFDEEAAG